MKNISLLDICNEINLKETVGNTNRFIKEIIQTGINKGTFRNVDPPLVLATFFGTINQVLLSNKMCNKLLNKDDLYVPYEDENFKHRVSEYLKQLMHTYLLVNQSKD